VWDARVGQYPYKWKDMFEADERRRTMGSAGGNDWNAKRESAMMMYSITLKIAVCSAWKIEEKERRGRS